MSVVVELPDLPAAVAQRSFGYLLTVNAEGRPHAVALAPEVDGITLRFTAGAGTCRNAAARPGVSVVFPPTERDDHSLVVDGVATIETNDGAAGGVVVVSPVGAVRHRPAP